MQFTLCVACKENNWEHATGVYEGFYKCSNCGFYGDFKHLDKIKSKIIVPEDPMDALMCESCQ